MSDKTSNEITAEVLLDVSELEPPEPLVLTLEAAEDLGRGQYLRMLHRRDPCLLYSNLENNHFKYVQREGLQSAVELFIWREDDAEAEAVVKLAIDSPDSHH